MHRHSVRFRTSVASDALAPLPIWKAEIPIADYIDGSPLHFTVNDEGGLGAVLGRARLSASQFAERGFNGELQLTGGKGIDAWLKVKIRNSGQEYPGGAPAAFKLNVQKEAPDSPVGLDVDIQDSAYAYVLDVRPGPFSSYNDTAPQQQQLQPGDFIKEVNDIKGDARAMTDAIAKVSKLTLAVVRPEELEVVLYRSNDKLPFGLSFPERLSGRSLLITGISQGAVKDWNRAHESFEVRVGDRIVMVDGVQSDASSLAQKMQFAQKVLLKIVRPADLDSTCNWKYW